jgi:hypothetical protein
MDSSSYPSDYSYDIHNTIEKFPKDLESKIELYPTIHSNKSYYNKDHLNKEYLSKICSDKKSKRNAILFDERGGKCLESKLFSKYSNDYSLHKLRPPFVRLLIEDTQLSIKDQYVIIGVRKSLTIKLPKLKSQIPLEEHGKIQHSNAVILISAPREESTIHIIQCASINTINMNKKTLTLKSGRKITLVAYGQTWFTV